MQPPTSNLQLLIGRIKLGTFNRRLVFCVLISSIIFILAACHVESEAGLDNDKYANQGVSFRDSVNYGSDSLFIQSVRVFIDLHFQMFSDTSLADSVVFSSFCSELGSPDSLYEIRLDSLLNAYSFDQVTIDSILWKYNKLGVLIDSFYNKYPEILTMSPTEFDLIDSIQFQPVIIGILASSGPDCCDAYRSALADCLWQAVSQIGAAWTQWIFYANPWGAIDALDSALSREHLKCIRSADGIYKPCCH